jgi:hypothetical protein
MRSYDRHLRVIGQSLEARRISVFELKSKKGEYAVSGTPEKAASFMAAVRSWRRQGGKDCLQSFAFGLPEIEQLERVGRGKRATPDRLPDFYNVSSLLRTLGAYLESKQARLLQIQKRPLTVTVLYQNENGHPQVEDRTIASFYDLFIEQYGRRSRPI